jgi:hypothetical protein
MTQLVVISDKVNNIIQTNSKITSIVHSGIPGIQGPQGEPGESNIGGYPFELSTLQNNDTLVFATDKWINRAQELLTDGGNF